MARIDVPKPLREVINILEDHGYSAYPVGGCVRDSLRGKSPKDWDAAVSATPEQVSLALKSHPSRVIGTGLAHGTVTVIYQDEIYELTTFRTDGEYSDNRRPDTVEFISSIYGDLARRDFTVNAIAYDCKNDKIIDPFHGAADIERGIIRCVGEAGKRFEEDSLRILRGLRFCSVLGFDIEKETSDAMLSHAELLKNVSYERIYSELKMILCGKNIEFVLRRYCDIFAEVLPEIKPMFDFPQINPYHCYDVWEHTVHAVANIEADPVLRMTALFHDSGKPSVHTREVSENGSITDHFYNHGAVSANLALTALDRLKADNASKDAVVYLVKHHGDVTAPTRKSVKRRLNKLCLEFPDGRKIFEMLIKVKLADVSAQAENVRASRAAELNMTLKIADEIITENECFSLKNLAVNGYDIMSVGYSGKAVGKILQNVLDMVISDRLQNNKDEIIKYIKSNSFIIE